MSLNIYIQSILLTTTKKTNNETLLSLLDKHMPLMPIVQERYELIEITLKCVPVSLSGSLYRREKSSQATCLRCFMSSAEQSTLTQTNEIKMHMRALRFQRFSVPK